LDKGGGALSSEARAHICFPNMMRPKKLKDFLDKPKMMKMGKLSSKARLKGFDKKRD
jgi:hypothetical protein